ncbi:hypothetical protein [Shimia sagamensis]|uniref:Type IV pilus biogenesis n=1 Tax=Shimia sagamensis TaxID=1566352 RepID=A0ABY1NMN4_9RHOB|nr:hypothetical protein [Shimia sagamensis]SMP13298.1 hypothetical protein SAMN06265373_102470 [Shimia sagamensis]
MTANLALTLSFEGIGLLTRVPGGWHLLGEVGLDSPDLAADLAKLRAQAVAVEGDDFTTTLVLPNDQIKYLTLPTGRMSEKKRRQQAEDALEVETPYRADQLVFDIAVQGRAPQVAAVARDTLDEAEAFAVEHAFNPVGFSAMPSEDSFASAPDFGDTARARAAGIKVTAEKTAIVVVGSGPLPKEFPEPVVDVPAAPVEPIADTPEKVSGAKPLASATKLEAGETNVTQDQPSAPVPKAATPEPKPEAAAPKPVVSKTGAPSKAAVGTQPPPPPNTKAAPQSTPDQKAEKPAEEPAAAFASIRAQKAPEETKSAPELSGVTRKVSGTNAPSIPTDSGDNKTPPLRFDPAKAVVGLKTSKDTAPSGTDTEAATFASARSKTKVAGPAPKAGKGTKQAAQNASDKEKQKAAMFGAGAQEVRGKPRHLGLILTTLLLVLMAIVALWASFATEEGLAGLFGADESEAVRVADAPAAESAAEGAVIAAAPAPETDVVATVAPAPEVAPSLPPVDAPMVVTVPDGMTPSPNDDAQTALLEPLIPESITDSAEIEAMMDEVSDGNVDPVKAEARYAVTGIWQRAPEQPLELVSDSSDDIYIASVDRDTIGFDAVALVAPEALDTDTPARAQVSPVAADTTFDLDERGLVVATADGALNPEGVMVFAGRPPVVPAAYPKRIKVGDEPHISAADNTRLATVRPKLRPGDLLEQNERATFGGLTLEELATIRPKLRPQNAKLADEKDTTPTQYAVKASPRPRLKPANIAQLAARAAPEKATAAAVAVPAAASVVPDIPTTASVARQATIKNAINLNKVNLIGVYGTSSNRRALVRLSSGRYKKVQVGDRVDGGRVSAISEDELHYTKGKRNVVLKMPKG